MRTINGKHGEFHVLTLDEIEGYEGQGSGSMSGGRLRFYCPIHESDRQRSLSVDAETGRFKCFSCGATGYVEDLGPNRPRSGGAPGVGGASRPAQRRKTWSPPPEPSPDLEPVLLRLQDALVRNTHVAAFAREYLERRGISLEGVMNYGSAPGYCGHGHAPQALPLRRQ